MPSSLNNRKMPEWPLLVLALGAVLGICLPLRQILVHGNDAGPVITQERLGHLFLGPEQIIAYVFFAWAMVIMVTHWREVWRQRRAFKLELLPDHKDWRILPEDATLLQQRVEQMSQAGGPYLLTRMINQALSCFGMNGSSQEARGAVQSQAEVDLGRQVASMSTVHYLAWGIPALGFVGTARGIGMGLAVAGQTDLPFDEFIALVTKNISVTFDTTLVALSLSVILMFFIHAIQRAEELLVLDCQQYCLDHVIKRLHSSTLSAPADATGFLTDAQGNWPATERTPV